MINDRRSRVNEWDGKTYNVSLLFHCNMNLHNTQKCSFNFKFCPDFDTMVTVHLNWKVYLSYKDTCIIYKQVTRG